MPAQRQGLAKLVLGDSPLEEGHGREKLFQLLWEGRTPNLYDPGLCLPPGVHRALSPSVGCAWLSFCQLPRLGVFEKSPCLLTACPLVGECICGCV